MTDALPFLLKHAPVPQQEEKSIHDQEEDEETSYDICGCGCCVWFCKGPFIGWNMDCKSRWTFIAWGLFPIISLILYLIYKGQQASGTYVSWAYILVCILAILISMFATVNFRSAIALKEQVKEFANTVNNIQQTQQSILEHAHALSVKHTSLVDIEEALESVNAELMDKYTKFQKWSEIIHHSTNVNLLAVEQLSNGFVKNTRNFERQLERAEKGILDQAFVHSKPPLDAQKFDIFLKCLPPSFRKRIAENENMSFESLISEHSMIDRKGFRKLMNNWKIKPVFSNQTLL